MWFRIRRFDSREQSEILEIKLESESSTLSPYYSNQVIEGILNQVKIEVIIWKIKNIITNYEFSMKRNVDGGI